MSNPVRGSGIFFYPKCPIMFWGPHSLFLKREVNHSPPYGAEVKTKLTYVWSVPITLSPPPSCHTIIASARQLNLNLTTLLLPTVNSLRSTMLAHLHHGLDICAGYDLLFSKMAEDVTGSELGLWWTKRRALMSFQAQGCSTRWLCLRKNIQGKYF